MSNRSNVPPGTVPVELRDEGIEVTYHDGRSVFYHGIPTRTAPPVRAQPGKDVHVLVTDDSGTEGVLIYVDERQTQDDILETTGVGRVLLNGDEVKTLFQGVTARRDDYAIEIDADVEVIEGRAFVFIEDELGEQAYELAK